MCGKIFAVLLVMGIVSARHGNKGFVAGASTVSHDLPESLKDISQWNIVQQLNGQQSHAAPGFVWIQVPVANVQQQAGASTNTQVQGVEGDAVQSIGQGIPPSFAAMQDRSTSTHTPIGVEPSVTDLIGRCLQPRGQFPSTACNKFVNCWDGSATEQECPGGLLFSSKKGYCDFADRVDCGGRPVVQVVGSVPPTSISGGATASSTLPPTPSAGQSSSASGATTSGAAPTTPFSVIVPTAAILPPVVMDPELKKYCLKTRGQFQSKTCRNFVNCWDDNIIEQECPEGLLFSDEGYCDYAASVDCGNRIPPKNEIPVTNGCPLASGTFRNESDCRSYYTCIGNEIVARYECPEGFNFSDYIGVCDYEDRVDCSKKPFIYQREASKEEFNTECPVEFGSYRDMTNCSSYYVCVSYKIVARHDCPAGFLYNDEIGVCDYSDRVNCTKTPKVFQQNNNFIPQLPTAYMDQIKSCNPGTLLRLNPQCSVVCQCRNGVAEIIQCPAGSAYDSASDKCVPPHLARC